MKFASYSFVIIALACILFGANKILEAQSIDPVGAGVIGQQISTATNPENPTPGQSVTLSLAAYGTNLNNATIAWSVNGSQVQKGTGLTQFSLNAGKNGEVKKVIATITLENGTTVTRTFTVAPQDVSIIYEADGYTPPFYKGKSTYAKEGTVTLVAMPNLLSSSGARLSPSSLTYKWIVDGTVQGSKSGYGKNTLSYTGTILGKDAYIEVEVASVDGLSKGKGNILLTPLNTEVGVYEENPLYGTMFNKEIAFNTHTLKDKEVTVTAIPFSTSASKLNDGILAYTWTINGSTIPVPKTQNKATFRNPSGQKGSSLIGVSVNNTSHLLQMIKSSLTINF